MNFKAELEEIEKDFYEESSQMIDNILGEKLTEAQKESLISSLFPLFREGATEIIGDLKGRRRSPNQGAQAPPCINLFLVQPSQYPYFIPPNISNQQPQTAPNSNANYPPLQNPYQFPMQPASNPYQYPLQQQPPFLPPNLAYFNQQLPQFTKPLKKKSKKDRKGKDKKSKKSHQKSDKKSKDEKKVPDETKYVVNKVGLKLGDSFSGIFKYLRDTTVKSPIENICSNGTIQITASRSRGSEEKPENLIEYNSKWFGGDAGSRDFWICFDFKKRKVDVTYYTIKSYQYDSGHMKNWVIETSDDKEHWTEIDRKQDDSHLNGKNRSYIYKARQSGFARYVRFRQTGEFWGYRPFITPGFSQIEFYGSIKSPVE